MNSKFLSSYVNERKTRQYYDQDVNFSLGVTESILHIITLSIEGKRQIQNMIISKQGIYAEITNTNEQKDTKDLTKLNATRTQNVL